MEKQTLEEAVEEYVKDSSHAFYELKKQCFLNGAKWQAERMYSEEEVLNLFKKYQYDLAQWVLRMEDDISNKLIPVEWFEQNKKK